MIDVFGSGPYSGNPLGVVHDAEGLSTEEMMEITLWLNLSETTFLLPPTTTDADYMVRIFTLSGELPFAGHPTLGTCHAWLTAGGAPGGDIIVQECGIGLISLRRQQLISFAAPPLIRSGPVDESFIADVAMVLGIEPAAELSQGDVARRIAGRHSGVEALAGLISHEHEVVAYTSHAGLVGDRTVSGNDCVQL